MPDADAAPAAARHRRPARDRPRRHRGAGPPVVTAGPAAASFAATVVALALVAGAAACGGGGRRGTGRCRGRRPRRVARAAVAHRARAAGPRAPVRRRVRLQPLGPERPHRPPEPHRSLAPAPVLRQHDHRRHVDGRHAGRRRHDVRPAPRPRLVLGAGPARPPAPRCVPVKAVAYYRPGVGIDPATVEPYPYGLKMLGGDQAASERPVARRRGVVVRHRLDARGHAPDLPRGPAAAGGHQLPRLLGRREPRQPRPRRRTWPAARAAPAPTATRS